MKEKCWKFVGKKGDKRREGRRERGGKEEKLEKKKRKERELEDKGGNERTREKGRLGSPESRRPVTPEVAKGRNNELQLGRCTVLCGAAGSHVRQSQHETSLRHLFLPGRSYEAGPPTLTAHSSHHCPRLRENTTKNNKKTTIWYPLIIKNASKTRRKRQIHVKHQQNTTKKRQKHDNLMSKIDQQRVLCFRNL